MSLAPWSCLAVYKFCGVHSHILFPNCSGRLRIYYGNIMLYGVVHYRAGALFMNTCA